MSFPCDSIPRLLFWIGVCSSAIIIIIIILYCLAFVRICFVLFSFV